MHNDEAHQLCTSLPLCKSHTRAILSSPPVSRKVPLLSNASALTGSVSAMSPSCTLVPVLHACKVRRMQRCAQSYMIYDDNSKENSGTARVRMHGAQSRAAPVVMHAEVAAICNGC